jgi:hypothetical protein
VRLDTLRHQVGNRIVEVEPSVTRSAVITLLD